MQGLLIRLRPPEGGDFPVLSRWVSFSTAGVLTSGGMADCLSAADWERMATGGNTRYAIVETLTGRAVGAVSWQANRYPGSFSIGGVIGDRDLWDGGHGMEAAMLAVDHLFQAERAHRVELVAALFNRRTVGFIVKGQVRVEAILRDHLFVDGTYHDAVVCSILREEYYQPYDGYGPSSRASSDAEIAAAAGIVNRYVAAAPSREGSSAWQA